MLLSQLVRQFANRRLRQPEQEQQHGRQQQQRQHRHDQQTNRRRHTLQHDITALFALCWSVMSTLTPRIPASAVPRGCAR
jgi:predicted RecB family nuclease